jgi:glutathione S-transferase
MRSFTPGCWAKSKRWSRRRQAQAAYALTLLRWGGFAGIDPTGFAATWAHVQRIAALPFVARAIERERLQLNLYKS